MLRISDARMSGTSYGACVLHVSPESHIGGPLAAVRTGDMISVDVENRRIDVELSNEEIAARLAEWQPPDRNTPRGYNHMFTRHIGQADEGCDFDFLAGAGGVPEPEIH
jgi:dihydroxy-acid dehydratase